MTDPVDVLAIRKELNLSQEDFAKALGVDQSTVSFWETGKFKPGGPAKRLMRRLIEDHRRVDQPLESPTPSNVTAEAAQ